MNKLQCINGIHADTSCKTTQKMDFASYCYRILSLQNDVRKYPWTDITHSKLF
jgi:hypothetical protein